MLNTKGILDDISPELKRLLDFIDGEKPGDDFTRDLDIAVKNARLNTKWRVEYMKTLLHDMDVREEGREEGIEQKSRDVIKKMLHKGMDIVDICELTECSEEYVEEVRKTL